MTLSLTTSLTEASWNFCRLLSANSISVCSSSDVTTMVAIFALHQYASETLSGFIFGDKPRNVSAITARLKSSSSSLSAQKLKLQGHQ
jgi:hypothetical protein